MLWQSVAPSGCGSDQATSVHHRTLTHRQGPTRVHDTSIFLRPPERSARRPLPLLASDDRALNNWPQLYTLLIHLVPNPNRSAKDSCTATRRLLLLQILFPCLTPVGRHHLTHPRRVGVASTRHTPLFFSHRCAPHTRAPPPPSHSNTGWLPLGPAPPGPTPAESPAPQPGNPPLQVYPRLPDSDPTRDPVPSQFDHLVTSPPLGPAYGHPTLRALLSSRPPTQDGPTRARP
jgi:hypothetical protein